MYVDMARFTHSQTGLVSCGGYTTPTSSSCVTFSQGSWAPSHTLQVCRYVVCRYV